MLFGSQLLLTVAAINFAEKKPERYQHYMDTGQVARIAAAANGLDVAFRWMERLGELAQGMRHGKVQTQSLDLSTMDSVFLGGSCGKTTWRKDVVMPMLDASKISYYNPQRADWSPALVPIEARAKDECQVLLFVIDDTTRSLVRPPPPFPMSQPSVVICEDHRS
jgi:hypothetical protein